jgi:hypothetical protein
MAAIATGAASGVAAASLRTAALADVPQWPQLRWWASLEDAGVASFDSQQPPDSEPSRSAIGGAA